MSRPAGSAAKPSAAFTTIAAPSRFRRADLRDSTATLFRIMLQGLLPPVNPRRVGFPFDPGGCDGYEFGHGRSVGADGRDAAAGCHRRAEIEPRCSEVDGSDLARRRP